MRPGGATARGIALAIPRKTEKRKKGEKAKARFEPRLGAQITGSNPAVSEIIRRLIEPNRTVLFSLAMDTLTKRRRGGQPGNKNALGNQAAVKTGWYTKSAKALRWQHWRELEARSKAWIASRPQTDYDAIVDELIQLQQEARSHAPQKNRQRSAGSRVIPASD
jgi:hypothetical protein